MGGRTALHICFGYARNHPRAARRRTRSCPSSPASAVDEISIETAQSNLDTAILATLPGKRIILGVLDLDDPRWRRPRPSPTRHPPRPALRRGRRLVVAPDCGMKYLPRDVAYGKLEALVAGAAQIRSEA